MSVLTNNQLLMGYPSVATKTVSYTATLNDDTILYNGVMDGSQRITLPTVGVLSGKTYTVKVISASAAGGPLNISTANAGEYAGNPQLYTIPAGTAIGGCVIARWDGAKYWLLQYSQ